MSWFQVAVAREGLSDIEGAIEAYEEALSRDPNYDLAWFNLGGLYANTGNISAAVETLRSAMSRFPEHELTDRIRQEQPTLYAAITET